MQVQRTEDGMKLRVYDIGVQIVFTEEKLTQLREEKERLVVWLKNLEKE